MKVEISDGASIQLGFMDDDDRKRVDPWIEYLGRWDQAGFVRDRSKPLGGAHNGDLTGVYVLSADEGFRLFFRLNPDEKLITVLDITTQKAIDTFGKPARGAAEEHPVEGA